MAKEKKDNGLVESAEIKRLKRKFGLELLWPFLLSILKKKPMHAYSIKKEIYKKFEIKVGNVLCYVVLNRLEARGYIKSKHKENRKIYYMTQKGKKLLQLGKKILKERFSKI